MKASGGRGCEARGVGNWPKGVKKERSKADKNLGRLLFQIRCYQWEWEQDLLP